MDIFECKEMINSLHAQAMKKIESNIKDFTFSEYGVKEGDVILYKRYLSPNDRLYYLYVAKITSNAEQVIFKDAELFINLKGFLVDEDGFVLPGISDCSATLDALDDRFCDKVIKVTNIKYKGKRNS